MVGWSSTLRSIGQNLIKPRTSLPKNVTINGTVRSMSGHGPRVLPMGPSRWQWHRTKDLLHYYTMVGIIPVTIIIVGVNVFVGPAALQATPDDYVPKHWEYYRSPITRFLARYLYSSPQQEYEKFLHEVWEESERIKLHQLEGKIVGLMGERSDYQSYYYKPVTAKYHRRVREWLKESDERQGD